MTEQVEQKLVNLGQLKKAIDKKAGSTSQSQDQYAKAITVEDSSKYDEKMELLCSTIKDFTDPSKDSHKALITADYANKQKIAENYTALDCSKQVYNTGFITENSVTKSYNSAYTRNTAKGNKATAEIVSDYAAYGGGSDAKYSYSHHIEQKADKNEASVLVIDKAKNILSGNSYTTDENAKSVALTTNHVGLPGVFVNKNDKHHTRKNNKYVEYYASYNINNTTSITTDCVRIKKFFTATCSFENKNKPVLPPPIFIDPASAPSTPTSSSTTSSSRAAVDDDRFVSNNQEMVAELGIEVVGIKHNEDFYAKGDLKSLVAYLTLDNVTMYKPIPEGDFEAYFN